MSFIRFKEIGPTTVYNSTSQGTVDISNGIDLSTYVTKTQLQTNPMHVVCKWTAADNKECYANFYTFHFTVYHDGSNYAYGGIRYSDRCPIETKSFGDWGEFEFGNEGVELIFSDDTMTIIAYVRSVNGIDITIKGYTEFYVKSDIL